MKFSISGKPTLVELAKQIHQSVIDTEKYQSSFACVKHSFPKKDSLKNRIIYKIIKNITYLYLKLIEKRYKIEPDYVFFERHSHWLTSAFTSSKSKKEAQQEISVTVNILKDFLAFREDKLFGSNVINSHEYVGEGVTIPNSLMLVFFGNHNKRYLRIHANLKPGFRELLGHDILNVLTTALQL